MSLKTSRMLQEIRQQPDALERTLNSGIRTAVRMKKRMGIWRPRLILIAARGTSDNAAQFGRYLLEITTRIPVSLAAPSVFTLYDTPVDLQDVLVAGISQSGESTDVNHVMETARIHGARTIGITNEAQSTLASIVDETFLVRAGKEQSVAATKTYTGQLMMLYLLSYALGGAIDLDSLRRVAEWTGEALELEDEVAEHAQRYRFVRQALVVGRGLNYSNALEFGLKLMETCQVVCERFSSADLLHGPIAMVGNSFPVFLFDPPGVTRLSTDSLLERLETIAAESLVIGDETKRSGCSRSVVLPTRVTGRRSAPVDLYTPIPYIVPAQLFAAHLADAKRLDADRPRTLSKVTQTM